MNTLDLNSEMILYVIDSGESISTICFSLERREK